MVVPGGKNFKLILEMISGKYDVGAIESHLKSFIMIMKKILATKSVHKLTLVLLCFMHVQWHLIV